MKKTEVAKALAEASILGQIVDNTNDHLVKIIESSFSALGTSDPIMCLSVLNQLLSQKNMLLDLKAEREKEKDEMAEMLLLRMPKKLMEN